MQEIKIKREIDGKVYEFSLTLNEVQRAYDAMLWATIKDEIDIRMELDPSFEDMRAHMDELVERTRDNLISGIDDDLFKEAFLEAVSDLRFEYDLEELE